MTSESAPIDQPSPHTNAAVNSLKTLYSAIPEPVFVCQPDSQNRAGRIVLQNHAADAAVAAPTGIDREPEAWDTSWSYSETADSIEHPRRRIEDWLVDSSGHGIRCCDGDSDQPALLQAADGTRTPVHVSCQSIVVDNIDLLVVTTRRNSAGSANSDSRGVAGEEHLEDLDYRHLLQNIQIPVTILDDECRIVLMNPAGAANLQMTPEEVTGRLFGDILPEFREITQQRVDKVLKTRRQMSFEDPVQLHDGIRWFRAVMQPMDGPDGRRLVWAVSYEFTDERETQQALLETNERIRHLASNIPGAIFQLARPDSGELRISYLGDVISRMLGPIERAARRDARLFTRIIHPDDRHSFRTTILQSVETRSDWQWEGRFMHAGDVRWVQAAASVRTSPDNETLWDGVVMDVTDTHRLDESLQSQEQQYRTLVEACNDGILVHNGDSILFVNRAAVSMFRADSAEQITGRRIMDVVSEESRPVIQDRINRMLNREEIPYTEATLKRLDGTVMMVEGIGSAITYRGQDCAQIVMRDVTERNALARTIRQSEERFRTLFNQAPVGIALVDSGGCARMSNPALQVFLGYSEDRLRQVPVHQLLVRDQQESLPHNWQQLLTALPDGEMTEQQFRRSDNSQVWGSLTVTTLPAGDFDSPACLLMLQDISDRKQAEERTRHLQRMEAIGRLTGGVAHDFNNLLAVISGNLELLSCQLDRSPLRELAANATTAADRGARLTRQLLAFGRRAPLRPGIIDLNQTIDEWQHLLHRTIPASIRIEASLHDAPLYGYVDEAELENALLNLALNARDAMPDGGCLTIETGLIPSAELPENAELQSADHLCIRFHDTGCGMEEAIQDLAFDPFFTTKEAGAGSGLGLSMVYGFIKQSGGHVTIRSRPQQGTTVELLLPCAPETSTSASAHSMRTPSLPGGGAGETVLVVEDNDNVREVILRQLCMLGYDAIHATCGSDALEIIRSDTHLDVLLTDVVMPGELQGSQLLEKARQLRPDIRPVLMSGYADQMAAIPPEGSIGRLAKPFSIHDLATAIRQALQPGN